MPHNLMELINGTLALGAFIIVVILIRDMKSKGELYLTWEKIKLPIYLITSGILVFSVKELYDVDFFGTRNSTISELGETLYFLITLSGLFQMLARIDVRKDRREMQKNEPDENRNV